MRSGARGLWNVVVTAVKSRAPAPAEPMPAGLAAVACELPEDPLEAVRRLMESGELEPARALLARIGADHPVWLEARRVAALGFFAAGRSDLARSVVDEVRARRANSPWALRLLARIEISQGDYAAAAALLSRLQTLLPDDAEGAADYAAVLRALGDESRAAAVEAEQAAWTRVAVTALPAWRDAETPEEQRSPGGLYLDLLERTVSNAIYRDPSFSEGRVEAYSEARRRVGRDLPMVAHTMIGRTRLRHLRRAVETILAEDIPGDLIETGVWRGGACILMRGVLAAHGDVRRRVFAADSFAGLPPPDERYPQDALTTFDFHLRPELAVSRAEVEENFARYGLLDERVVFIEGRFRDTLPALAATPMALLRLDGDLYSSTMDALTLLYDCVSPGGFIIIDDYGAVLDARRAVLDFRDQRGVRAPMTAIDGDAVYWRKP